MAAPPDLNLENYRIGKPLRESELDSVYLGERLEPFREVTIRVLTLPDPDDSELSEKLKSEAHTAVSFDHTNLVQVLDSGIVGRHFYCISEYLSGGSLENRLGPPMDPDDALDIARSVAAGLRHIHERGFVHRDVRPSNILFDQHGEPKLADFGISKAFDARGFPTERGLEMESSPYQSPEERDGGELDERSDFYSLGVILHEMLAGRRSSPSDPRPELPEELEELQPVLRGMLARSPSNRFVSATALIRALQQDRSTKGTRPLSVEERKRGRTTGERPDDMDHRTTRRFIDQEEGDDKKTRKVRLRDRRNIQALVWTGITALGVFLAAASVLAIQWILDRL
ncbi:MAG: serine/threonine-protein kinase [Xanthomonadales bacterium]|nr:serine/threonine-protein kinase [Xanthomonadales bacterium]